MPAARDDRSDRVRAAAAPAKCASVGRTCCLLNKVSRRRGLHDLRTTHSGRVAAVRQRGSTAHAASRRAVRNARSQTSGPCTQ
jgi:hypothetical protein